MVRCSLCMTWYHTICVDQADYTSAFYACAQCCTLAKNVTHISNCMVTVITKIEAMKGSIDHLTIEQGKLVREIKDIRIENTTTKQDNAILRSELMKLRAELHEQHWKRLDCKKPRLVVGSSVLRDIDETSLDNTKVMSISGGKLADVKEKLDNETPEHFGEITIVVGGNDCQDDKPVTDIVSAYKEVITIAKTKAPVIMISSILPRYSPDDTVTQQKIDTVNAELQATCEDAGAQFINNDDVFRLRDGTINDGYFLTERGGLKQVHLNDKGTSRLCQNLKITVKAGMKCTRIRSQRQARFDHTDNGRQGLPPPPHRGHFAPIDPPRLPRDQREQSPPRPQWARGGPFSRRPPSPERPQQPYRPSDNDTQSRRPWPAPNQVNERPQYTTDNRSQNVQCHHCGDYGHVKRQCWYTEPIQCTMCYQYGHKSKACPFADYIHN